jgi:hypothetical protein
MHAVEPKQRKEDMSLLTGRSMLGKRAREMAGRGQNHAESKVLASDLAVQSWRAKIPG